MLIEGLVQLGEPLGFGHGVIVEKRDALTLRHGQSLVDRVREPAALDQLDGDHIRFVLPEPLTRVVVGRVVHHNGFKALERLPT